MAIRQEAPGASIIIDTQTAPWFRETYLRELGMAEGLRIEEVPAAVLGVDSPVRAGAFRGGPDWVLHAASDTTPPRVLLVGRTGDEIRVVDARLAERAGFGDDSPREEVVQSVSSLLVRARVDSGMLVLLMPAGGLLLPRHGLPSVVRPARALVVGVALQGAVGLLRLPGVWSHVKSIVLAVLLGVLMRRSHMAG